MLKPSISVKSENILRILLVWGNPPPLAFFRFIRCFPNDLFSGFTWWTVGGSLINGAKANCKKITQFRRRTNKQSQLWILLLYPVSLARVIFLQRFSCSITEAPWRKSNSAPVCFGAKDNQFGRFQLEVGGSIQDVKLVHLSRQVTCNHRQVNTWSKWGCGPL